MSDTSRLVSVLGGYGIFGGRIAEALARVEACRVRVVGRNAKVGGNFAHRIGAEFRASALDNRASLRQALEGSFLVIHAAGPFQGADYRVAEMTLQPELEATLRRVAQEYDEAAEKIETGVTDAPHQ